MAASLIYVSNTQMVIIIKIIFTDIESGLRLKLSLFLHQN